MMAACHALGGAGLLALADKTPNLEARALSPQVGWWFLAFATLLALFFVLQREKWRLWWFRMEDPRSLGLFRICFGFFVIANINGLWEYFRFLFTDEGIFTADVARQVFASAQFQGFGDGLVDDEPWGFFDFEAVLQWLKGPKYSLLYFWDSPTFFWIHLAAFELCGVLFMVGLWTRPMAFLTFFLMNSIMLRNHLFWEGTELVYRVFLAYLVVSRCGHAYSVDNWLRCRRLRKKGLLSERGGPGDGAGLPPSPEHPKGLEPIYRLIPAWPRRLMMLQLATIYTTTGMLKNGSVWAKGDAFYYALNLDHFYRFYPQPMSHYFGTNLFRLMTWVTHWWEAFFFLVIVGLVIRFQIYERIPPLSGWRKHAFRLVCAGLVLTSGMILHIVWPVHFTPFPRPYLLPLWFGLWAAVYAFWWWLGNRPPKVGRIFKWKLPRTYVLDREWFARWFLGRRLWLGLAVVFQLHLVVLMNIGLFQHAMLAANITYLTGYEAALLVRALGRRLGRFVPWIPEDVRRGEPPTPAEDPTLPGHHRDAAEFPEWALLALVAYGVGAIVARAMRWTNLGWLSLLAPAAVFIVVVAWIAGRRARGKVLPLVDEHSGLPRLPWAYGPVGRAVVGTLLVWHMAAVAIWLLPDKDSLHAFRGPARAVVSKWLTVTQTDQGWGMFAPNPPRANIFMKVLVTDQDGNVWDLRTDVYAPERKPIPWIWNDRARKMNRRIIGGESGGGSWYRKWYARWVCRDWELSHGGVPPKKVELVKVWYTIPTPEQVRDLGWYVPEDLYERSHLEQVVYTEDCAKGIMAQTPPWIRERHGLPPEGPNKFRPWIKRKKRTWEARKKRRKNRGARPPAAKLNPAKARPAKPAAD